MAEKSQNPEQIEAVVTETLPDGSVLYRKADGGVEKIEDVNGKTIVAKNLTAKGDASLIKRVEDVRWPLHLTVAGLVERAVEEFVSKHEGN